MATKNQSSTIKSVLQMMDKPSLDECEIDAIRAMLAASIVQAPVKSAGKANAHFIELQRNVWRIDGSSAQGKALAENTRCAVCAKPVRFARIQASYTKSKQTGWSHYGCSSWSHPAGCACNWCFAISLKDFHFGFKPVCIEAVKPSWLELNARLGADSIETKETIATRLSVCACGHGSNAHSQDKLENLLECGADGCDCDHFHYSEQSAVDEWIDQHPEIAHANQESVKTFVASGLGEDIDRAESDEALGADTGW